MHDADLQVKALAAHSSVKALVVDDEEVNRILLVDALEAIGVDVREAVNGKEALERIGEEAPDIVFLDLRMPVMDGMETLKRINADYGYQRFNIVATSASDSPLQRNEFLHTGCTALVSKPFRLHQIFDCLKKLPGVEFVYHEVTQDAPESAGGIDFASIRVPAEQFLAIKDAIEKDDASEVKRVLAQLNLQDDEGDRLAAHLAALLDENNLQKILAALDKCLIAGIGHD